jgi:hypothetical protein
MVGLLRGNREANCKKINAARHFVFSTVSVGRLHPLFGNLPVAQAAYGAPRRTYFDKCIGDLATIEECC